MEEGKSTWRFPREFWTANIIELFERAAYYGCFIYLTVYLTQEVGFTDSQTGNLTGAFTFFLYFMPTFMGAIADKFGFRRSLVLAFGLLALGYALLGVYPSKMMSVVSLTLIMFGAAIVKPVVSGTVAKCSDEHNRARAFSLFYQAVNIGSFSGKGLVEPIRSFFRNEELGISGLREVNYWSTLCAVVAMCLVLLFFRVTNDPGKGKSFRQLIGGLGRVLTDVRFMCIILIAGLFWTIQVQLYATMPKYLLRMVSDFAKPGWLANVNPLVVVLMVVPITHLVRKIRPVSSIGLALLISPLAALPVALAPSLGTGPVNLGFVSVHPIMLMLVIGIIFQGLGECFLSPRYLEYASKQAPPGEEGLYMGYSHLSSAFSWAFGFILSGRLLEKWCPDPEVVKTWPAERAAHAYEHAHYIWFVYAGIGVVAFVALMIFRAVTDRIDARKK